MKQILRELMRQKGKDIRDRMLRQPQTGRGDQDELGNVMRHQGCHFRGNHATHGMTDNMRLGQAQLLYHIPTV